MNNRNKRKVETYAPHKKYVFAEYSKCPIPATYTEKDILAGLESNQIITLEAWKQRKLVYEINGQHVSAVELANTKKIAKMQKNGKIVSASTYRNRKLQLRLKSITKITDYDEALQVAVDLTKIFPSPIPHPFSRFRVHEETMKQLYALPTVLWNKMGIVSVRKSDFFYRVIIQFEQYKKWYSELLIVSYPAKPKDKTNQVASTKKTSNTPLQAHSIFSNTLPSHRNALISNDALKEEINFTDLLSQDISDETLNLLSLTLPLFQEPTPEEQDNEYRRQWNP